MNKFPFFAAAMLMFSGPVFSEVRDLGAVSLSAIKGTEVAVPAHPAVQGASLTWSPDGMRLLGYSPDQTDVVDIDLSGARPTRVIPVAFDQEARWQRVAP